MKLLKEKNKLALIIIDMKLIKNFIKRWFYGKSLKAHPNLKSKTKASPKGLAF